MQEAAAYLTAKVGDSRRSRNLPTRALKRDCRLFLELNGHTELKLESLMNQLDVGVHVPRNVSFRSGQMVSWACHHLSCFESSLIQVFLDHRVWSLMRSLYNRIQALPSAVVKPATPKRLRLACRYPHMLTGDTSSCQAKPHRPVAA